MEVQFRLDDVIPNKLKVGEGQIILISGWIYLPNTKVVKASIVINGVEQKINQFNLLRTDNLFENPAPKNITNPNIGFYHLLELDKSLTNQVITVDVEFVFNNNKVYKHHLGEVTLEDGDLNTRVIDKKETVAICMATYNPPIDLFKKQLNSIKNQTHTNWHLYINDDCSSESHYYDLKKIIGNDPRISLFRNTNNLGYYKNFEQTLHHALGNAQYIAFADQDDEWHSNKLEVCLNKIKQGYDLVYSDMNIVDQNGNILHNTFWNNRKNQFKDFDTLLTANTVTGAASLFKADLLKLALPFPLITQRAYHDHWIAVCALQQGKIGFINESLYNYTQHENNVIGHTDFAQPKLSKSIHYIIGLLYNALVILTKRDYYNQINKMLMHSNNVFYSHYLRFKLYKQLLQLRTTQNTKGMLYKFTLRDAFLMLLFHLKILLKKFSTNSIELNLLNSLNLLILAKLKPSKVKPKL